jgi:hypothetical protein
MPGTLLSNGTETCPLSSDGLTFAPMSQRLRALMLGIASALKNGPAATSSVWDSGHLKNISFSHRQPLRAHCKTSRRPASHSCTDDAAGFHQIINRFPAFWRRVHKLQHGKVYGWVLLPTIIQCSFDRTQTAPHRPQARPLVGNVLLIAWSAMRSGPSARSPCEYLRLATVSDSAFAG